MKAQMKISRRKFIAAAVLLMTALTGTLVYAAYVSSAKVANSFSSGGVNIEAECLQERDGELVPAGELTVADLDSVVSYIPRITNRAEESYIRVRLEAESAGRISWKNLFYRSGRRTETDSPFYRRIRCEDPGF